VGGLNRFLGGSAFDTITQHAISPLSIFVANRQRRD
jgi:hypothetical protein